MSSVLRLRRDTSSVIATATGAQGEVFCDITKNILVVQDGATPGGFPLAKAGEVQSGSLTKATAGGTVNAITATFPSANVSTISDGQPFTVISAGPNTGNVTATFTIGTTALPTKPVLKGLSTQLANSDTGAAGYPMALLYSTTLDAYILLNPAAQTGGKPVKTTIYNTAGTFVFAKQASTTMLRVKVQGGGGGGGAPGANATGYASCSGGGGAGGYTEKEITAPLASYSVTVGAAGNGVLPNTSGGNGGSSSFGAVCTAIGGGGGNPAASSTGYLGGSGGGGGAASGGDLNIPGSSGQSGWSSGGAQFGVSGAGGSSRYGFGGESLAGTSIASTVSKGYGAGASGGVQTGGSSGAGSQPGGVGIVIVEEYA